MSVQYTREVEGIPRHASAAPPGPAGGTRLQKQFDVLIPGHWRVRGTVVEQCGYFRAAGAATCALDIPSSISGSDRNVDIWSFAPFGNGGHDD